MIALLDIEGKAYASTLLAELAEWVSSEGLLHFYQTGFRSGGSTIDNIIALSYLAQQAAAHRTPPLFACFIDYTAAFDGVDRTILWQTLASWNIRPSLLQAIRSLYSRTRVRVKLSCESATEKIATDRGLEQGCVLAPMLFNVYTTDMGKALQGASLATPRIGHIKIQLMQYADDLVLLDYTKIGLQKALTTLSTYNTKHKLVANQTKSKIVIFGTYPKKQEAKWRLGSLTLNSAQTYNYLGAWFCETSHPRVHLHKLQLKGKMVTYALCKLYTTLDSPTTMAIQKVLRANLLPSLNYAQQAFPGRLAQALEKTHCAAYKRVFHLPACTRNILICLEFNLNRQSLEDLAAFAKYFYQTMVAQRIQ